MALIGSGDDMYDCEVNKGSLNMRSLTATLNKRWREGWELDQVFPSGEASTVLVFKRRADAAAG
jgi:hypothetical protein